jgi:transcriptional regulator with XRE-family HTH domain
MPRVLMSRAGQDREALNRELARLPRDLTTAITRRMKQQGMNRAELARAMGVSPGRVSQILSGDGNLTLHTLAAVCVALDARLEARLVPDSPVPVSPAAVTPGVPVPVPDNDQRYSALAAR